MRDGPVYARLAREMQAGTDADFLADLGRFLDSFGDHDPDCPGFHARGREDELDTCTCGFARRYVLLDELKRRLERSAR